MENILIAAQQVTDPLLLVLKEIGNSGTQQGRSFSLKEEELSLKEPALCCSNDIYHRTYRFFCIRYQKAFVSNFSLPSSKINTTVTTPNTSTRAASNQAVPLSPTHLDVCLSSPCINPAFNLTRRNTTRSAAAPDSAKG